MEKVKIKIVTLGYNPVDLNLNKIKNHKSEVFNISKKFENFSISCNAKGSNWEYYDEQILEELNTDFQEDIYIAITSVPLEDNYYARRLTGKVIIITLHEVKEILFKANIPVENLVLYLLYAYSLAYKFYGNNIPSYDLNSDEFNLIHHETKGCLYDMHGIKTDVVFSCNKPIICDSCVEKLKNHNNKLSYELIDITKKELQEIKKDLFYRVTDFIKKNPLRSLVISTISVIILGIVSSICATLLLGKFNQTEKIQIEQDMVKINKKPSLAQLFIRVNVMSDKEEMKDYLNSLIEEYPQAVFPYLGFYYFFEKINDTESSKIILEKCIKNAIPNNIEEYYELAKALYKKKLYEEKQKEYIKYVYLNREKVYSEKDNILNLYNNIFEK